MNDRSHLKSHGEKVWKTGRTKRKTEKTTVIQIKLKAYQKEQNGAYLSDRILNYKMSGIASESLLKSADWSQERLLTSQNPTKSDQL
jgi:hypothetical protein